MKLTENYKKRLQELGGISELPTHGRADGLGFKGQRSN
jgi:hypothetical protein